MTNEKQWENELISDAELDNVAGGTYQELNDLYSAMNGDRMLRKYLKNYKPGNIDVNEISSILKNKLGVEFKYNENGANEYEFYRRGDKVDHNTVVNELKRYEWTYNHF